MINVTSPITGLAITPLVTPTYTVAADFAPNAYGKQFAVKTLGGTQTGVSPHSIQAPFTATFSRPPVLKQIAYNATGTVKNIPVNSHKLIVRKGLLCLPNVYKNGAITVVVDLPAGSESYDAVNVSALFSCAIGLLTQQAQLWRDTVSDGLL